MTVAQPKPQQAKKKSAAQRLWFLHWLMAAFYLLLFAGGNYMADLPREVSYRGSMYDFHKTLGVIVMSLLLARIFVLLRVIQHKYRRRLPKFTRDWVQTFVLHAGLYFFMLLVPLSGYFFSNSFGKDVIIFGTNIALPRLFVENKPLAELGRSVHFWLSYSFLSVVVLHMVAQGKYLRSQLRRFSKMVIAALSSKAKQVR
ncbi:MAG: cytochrome b [Potamolinea sp.]